MSSILRALRRVEQEKARPATRPLREEVIAPAPPPAAGQRTPRDWSALRPYALGAASAGLVLLAVYAWTSWTPPSADATQTAAAPPAPAVSTPPDGPPGWRDSLWPEDDDAPPGAVPAKPAPTQRAAPPPEPEPQPTYTPTPAPPKSVVEPTFAPPEPTPAPVTRPAPRAPQAPKPAPAKPAPKPVVETAYEPPLSDPADLPVVVQRKPMPEIAVDRIVWHPSAERRLATLTVEGHDEPMQLKEGGIVAGVSVLQIDPGAVVFLHRGVEVRLRVGD